MSKLSKGTIVSSFSNFPRNLQHHPWASLFAASFPISFKNPSTPHPQPPTPPNKPTPPIYKQQLRPAGFPIENTFA